MKPLYQIIADGQDVTDKIKDRLVSLQVQDEDGYSSDRMTIVLDDRDAKIALPQTGAKLQLSLGTSDTGMTKIGTYVVTGIKGQFPVRKLTVSAMAADMAGSIRDRKTRSWSGQSVGQIVKTIANENGLTAAVGSSIAGVVFPFLAQTAESDLNFLTRIGLQLDATAKPADGHLTMQKRGEGVNAAGDKIDPVAIPVGRISTCRWRMVERDEYSSVEAEWADVAGGSIQIETAGSGTPKRRLRHVYSSQGEAQRAANSELAMAGRSALQATVELAGFEPAVFAGGLVTLPKAIRNEFSGNWFVTQVEHNLADGLATKFSAEKAR